jgi:hypothetical protein
MDENNLMRAFSEDLVDLRATLSDKSRHQQLRQDIEQRERALAVVLEADAKDQSARQALREGGKTPSEAGVKAAAAASKAMDQSGATSLKRLLVETTAELAKLFNEVPDTLNHWLRKGKLKLGPAPRSKQLANGEPLQLTDGKSGELEKKKEGPLFQQVVREIPRVHHEDLSISEFLRKYAIPKKPVVITGLNFTAATGVPGQEESPDWSLDFFRETCGEA